MAGEGVAGARVVEAEDADVAEVGGGDVVGFEEGGKGGGRAGERAGRRGAEGREEEEEGGAGGEEEGTVVGWTHVWGRERW